MPSEPRRKALFIKGLLDAEHLVRIAKSEAVKTGFKGKISVVNIGQYIPQIEGQAVIVEEIGSEYGAEGSGSLRFRNRHG